jgi:hypothetical protein
MQMLLEMKCPSAQVHDETGEVLMSLIDGPTLAKLKRRYDAVSQDEPLVKKQGLFSRLITDDIKATRGVWETMCQDLGFRDVNKWSDLGRD